MGPLAAHAGVAYDVAVRPVDLSNVALASSNPAPPVVSHYFVQDGQVRVGDAGGKRVYVFKDKTLYVIDNASRTVHVLKHATLGQVAAHYADTVKQLQAAAAQKALEKYGVGAGSVRLLGGTFGLHACELVEQVEVLAV